MSLAGEDELRPYVILRIDVALIGSQPSEAVAVKGFAVDRKRAEAEVDRLNGLGRTDRIYVHRVARGIESVMVNDDGSETGSGILE